MRILLYLMLTQLILGVPVPSLPGPSLAGRRELTMVLPALVRLLFARRFEPQRLLHALSDSGFVLAHRRPVHDLFQQREGLQGMARLSF